MTATAEPTLPPPFVQVLDTDIVIAGTGFAGLGMAIKLKKAGVESFVLLERALEIGGTWRDNHYPGCACDIPSELYSFSFEREFAWTRDYPTQPEILAYLQKCADTYGIRPHVRHGSEIVEARYDERAGIWKIGLRDGSSVRCRVFVSAMGGLSRPNVPTLPGLECFQGHAFHSAQWDHAYDMTGKTVAVVGTGASAIQFVPKIAVRAERVYLFQRTPPWIIPKVDNAVGPLRRALMRVPGVAWLRRKAIYWIHEVRALGFAVDPRILGAVQKIATQHLEQQIADPALRALVTPHYHMGCKRILLSNDYYPALTRDNVELIAGGVSSFTSDGVVGSDGVERKADVVVLATGFHATHPFGDVRIFGRGGLELNDVWKDGMEAFLGVNVAGFPNLFVLVGPNTGLGHNSMVFMIESQVRYVMGLLDLMKRTKTAVIDVKRQVQDGFNGALQKRMSKTVWKSGCKSWYLDENGKNTVLWPGFSFTYGLWTRRVDAARYDRFRPVPAASKT